MEQNTVNRKALIRRETRETSIELKLSLDGTGTCDIDTGVGFLDHMLTLFAVHGSFDLQLKAVGDTQVDDHHTVEDIGICLGQAIGKCLGKKAGIARYGTSFMVMDETLVRVVLDLSNRPFLHYDVPVSEQKIGNFDSCLALEFFRAVSQHAGITLHIDLLHGGNGHHIIEAVFKGFARAISQATAATGQAGALSSKGCL